MREIKPDKSSTLWIVAMACLCFGTGIYAYTLGKSEQAKYELAAREGSRKYANYTEKPERDSCFRIPLADQQYCIAKTTDKAREQQRYEEDLVAQKVTALWTYLMGVAAIVGASLSAFGVFLVWTTFNETKRANDIATSTGRIQLRAYLHMDGSTVKFSQNGFQRIYGTITIKNCGQTPARNVQIFTAWAGEFGDFKEEWTEYEFTQDDSKGVIGNGGTLVANFNTAGNNDPEKSLTEYQVTDVMLGKRNFWIYGVVTYDDIFGDHQSLTFRHKLAGDQWNPRFNICSEGNSAT